MTRPLLHQQAVTLLVAALLCACGDSDDTNDATSNATTATSNATTATSNATTATSNATTSSTSGGTTGGETTDPDRAQLVHSFGAYTLEGGEEVQPCVSWTLNNDEALYVQSVQLANTGGFHHSNWFVVPEGLYAGEDGYFNCREREFQELTAAVAGTVLFAQSTQSLVEEQRLGDGVVIKIPPRHKVVAGVHLLNLSPREVETELRMTLELLHPRLVQTVVSPFRLSYYDLDIPPNGESRFSSECLFADSYQELTGEPYSVKLHWALPHYHYLGNHFRLEVVGGPMDGEALFELDGFNAEANGQAFRPPVDLTGSQGFRFTCGYHNVTDEAVGWGIGDQEMCVMLGFIEGAVLLDASVSEGTAQVGTMEGDVPLFEGPCDTIVLPKNRAQSMPTEDELAADLYAPESDPGDIDLPPVPDCVDFDPDAAPDTPATLTRVHETIFAPSCTFSSCHDASSPASRLDLSREGLHARLIAHEPLSHADMPLVTPGDPAQSLLFQRLASCAPTDHAGNNLSFMPLNSPILLDDALLATLRAWIADGAQDD